MAVVRTQNRLAGFMRVVKTRLMPRIALDLPILGDLPSGSDSPEWEATSQNLFDKATTELRLHTHVTTQTSYGISPWIENFSTVLQLT
jgi:hypothetical protein